MADTDVELAPAPRWARWASWALGIASLVTLVLVALHFTEAVEFARLARRADWRWLFVASALQVGTYLFQGQVFRSVARRGRCALDLRLACELGFAKLFVDQAVPSAGFSGTWLLAKGLERHGIRRPVVAAAIVVDLVSYYTAYVLCLALALVFVCVHDEANAIIVVTSLVFFAFAIGLCVLVLELSGRGTAGLPRRLRKLHPLRILVGFVRQADPRLARHLALLAETTGYQLGIVLCDASTLWVLVEALGNEPSIPGVFASFMISSLLRTFGIMPGGLGTFEAASVITLHMVGIPVAVGLSSTLLFRGLTFWLPLLPGLWFSDRAARA